MPGKISVYQIITNSIATDTSELVEPWSGRMTFQANGTTSAGAGTATVLVEGSLDNTTFLLLGTLTLAFTTTAGGDGVAVDAPWSYMRMRITAITGTDATINGYVGG
jgi:hypothetical protein